jgi:hypothetical protein
VALVLPATSLTASAQADPHVTNRAAAPARTISATPPVPSPTAVPTGTPPTVAPTPTPPNYGPVATSVVARPVGSDKVATLPTLVPTTAPAGVRGLTANPNALTEPVHPERLPGEHTLDFGPDYYLMWSIHPTTCAYSTELLPPSGQTLAGWAQERCGILSVEGQPFFDDRQDIDSFVSQSGPHFDLTQLDQIPAKTVTGASLTFDEARFRWTDADGTDHDVRGCISTVGLPTVDWHTNPPDSLIPNTTVADFSPWPSDRQDFSGTQFDVTGPVQSMLQQLPSSDQRLAVPARDLNPMFPNSFVLRGAREELHGDDQSSCMSSVTNVKLQVTYVVPER